MRSIGEERRADMNKEYPLRCISNEDSVLKLTQSLKSIQRRIAKGIVRDAADFMESQLGLDLEHREVTAATGLGAGQEGSGRALLRTTSFAVEGLPEPLSELSGLMLDTGSKADASAQTDHIDELRDWVAGEPLRLEKGMYNPIIAFVSYVALRVQVKARELDGANSKTKSASTGPRRLIRPVWRSDYKPEDSDDNTRIDIGLCAKRLREPAPDKNERMLYSKLLTILEAKVKRDDSEDATVQLFEYTRQMYQQQHDLRFAWGITICGHDVRVCHFGNDKAISSRPMDVTTSGGRRSFIELLVNWSLCDDSQLGRDPTMKHLPDLKCWQIDCLDDATRKSRRYYFSTVICHADRLFGRHTRCFLATDLKPKRADGYHIEPTVVIKDAWAFAERSISKDARDEIKSLNKIKDKLAARKDELEIIIPEIAVGGRVWFEFGGKHIEDNTNSVYGLVLKKAKKDIPFRAHRRIVMSPIGKPLHTVESADEFATVVCDAMRCHDSIVQHCGILHRDISENNVLVVRQNGISRGLLIDFDCAIDMSGGTSTSKRPEMTGTLPFMSINNLRNSDVQRTVLDDWESMLCLICWMATFGID
ncbi:hypothetical protein GGI00_001100 [Coemansia sp. RSA 2681]|nr:hypothetical protein GGI00_001100 [Coemansia sp. RSA 2681]